MFPQVGARRLGYAGCASVGATQVATARLRRPCPSPFPLPAGGERVVMFPQVGARRLGYAGCASVGATQVATVRTATQRLRRSDGNRDRWIGPVRGCRSDDRRKPLWDASRDCSAAPWHLPAGGPTFCYGKKVGTAHAGACANSAADPKGERHGGRESKPLRPTLAGSKSFLAVPCASRRPRAGPNSRIPALGQSGLSPAVGCDCVRTSLCSSLATLGTSFAVLICSRQISRLALRRGVH